MRISDWSSDVCSADLRLLGKKYLMNDRKLLGIGIVGSVVAALCCFTPILVVLLGAVGLSAMLGWLDYVLLPSLVFFLGLTRSEEHTSELQSLMRISYAVFCLKKKNKKT